MRVILFLLKCIVGFLASVGLVVLLVAVGLYFTAQYIPEWAVPRDKVPEAAVATLDLSGGVVERRADSPIALARGSDSVPLHETVDAIDAAAADDRVKALAVRLGSGGLGLAQAQELHQAIERFRAAGKPAFAFAETMGGGPGGNGTLHAYLSSAFEQVWMQPSGDYGATGFQIESPFLQEALAEWGIEPRMDQRREYKGFTDRFTAMQMPEPQVENRGRLLDSWLTQVVTALVEGRGLAASTVRQAIDSAPLSAEDAKAAGLVDMLGYADGFEDAVAVAAGGTDTTIALGDYAALRQDDLPDDAPRIATVFGLGGVTHGESENNPAFGDVVMGADTVAPAIRTAIEDESVSAIVFRVDSPGGSYVASDTIWRAVKLAREADKPIVVSMGDIAASGGYFVAAPANRIVAQPGTITGSIGVASGKFVLTGLWDQLGIAFDGVQAGKQADFWSFNNDFSEAEWAQFQRSLDETYADFTGKVAAGRDLSDAEVSEAAQGRIWSGADAKAMGLVDELGGFRHAVVTAKQLAGIDPETRVRLVEFPERRDPFRRFLEDALAGRIDSPAARSLAELTQSLRPLIDLVEVLQGSAREDRLAAPPAVAEAAQRR